MTVPAKRSLLNLPLHFLQQNLNLCPNLNLNPDPNPDSDPNPTLGLQTEESLYAAVIAWLRHDLPSRSQHAYSVLRWVRLPLLHRDFILNEVDECDLLRQVWKFSLSHSRSRAFALSRYLALARALSFSLVFSGHDKLLSIG